MSYETANTRAEPYTKIVEELPGMRRDTVALVKKAVREAEGICLSQQPQRRECTLDDSILKQGSWSSNYRPRTSVVVLNDPSVIAP